MKRRWTYENRVCMEAAILTQTQTYNQWCTNVANLLHCLSCETDSTNTRHGYVRAAIALCTVRYERSLHRIFCLPIGTTENTLVFTVLCSAHCVWCVSQGIFVKKFFRSHSLIRILCELCFGSEQGLRAHIMRLPHNPYSHFQLSLNPLLWIWNKICDS